ncbi:hypothetical protein GCM10027176_01320 [Actinoallomurus bryophytorum]|uniref:DUF3592 domain-containing protein n=1 Tax=Actinoallomurus bryophytorum TaxID=1490222 RepID=A0A543CEC0_9ACTN|nr:hypothetical protein FB559_0947 [Actinoallomurus bryophytorum]
MPFLGVCVLAFAGLLIFGTVSDVVRSSQVRRRGAAATAEVIGINPRTGLANYSRSRVVRFTTAQNREVTVAMPRGRLRDVPVGGRTGIRYLPEKPEVVRSPGGGARFASSLFGVAVCVALGVSLLIS